MTKHGYLVLIGGAEDKSGGMFVLRRIIKLNDAKKIVVIPTASSYPASLGEKYHYAFRNLGVTDVEILDVRDKHETEREDYLEKARNADLIFFTGGDQVRLVETLEGSPLIEIIHRRFLEGVTIAGTSAGAAAASSIMLYDGEESGLTKGSVHTCPGFGFLRDISVDTHFDARGRLTRFTQFLLGTKGSGKGIGLGEDTAVIIDTNRVAEVIGAGIVTLVDTSEVSYSNISKIGDHDPIVVNGVKIGFLQEGSIFNLDLWKVVPRSGAIEKIVNAAGGLLGLN